MKYLSKRNLLGALLFLIFVGEVTVGNGNGLFTLPGLLVLYGLYYVLFMLYEALVVRFKLTYTRLALLTFALYSVLVTGLLHGEIASYVTHPEQNVITTMIRLQCSLFPVFAYYLLNKYTKRDVSRILSAKAATLLAFMYVLLLTTTKKFGFTVLLNTLHTAPAHSLIFITLGLTTLVMALRPAGKTSSYQSKSFTITTWVLFGIACVPTIATLILLLIAMPLVTAIYWVKPAWRQAKA